MAKVALQKYRLTQAQLRSLTIAERPELEAPGRVVLVPNETGKPYRLADATSGAPVGFGFYVGPLGAFYELRMQHEGVRRRIALGSVHELTLARAHELAGAQLQTTGVPAGFKVEYACRTPDPEVVEQAMHVVFGPRRVNDRREFFEIEADQVIAVLALHHQAEPSTTIQ